MYETAFIRLGSKHSGLLSGNVAVHFHFWRRYGSSSLEVLLCSFTTKFVHKKIKIWLEYIMELISVDEQV